MRLHSLTRALGRASYSGRSAILCIALLVIAYPGGLAALATLPDIPGIIFSGDDFLPSAPAEPGLSQFDYSFAILIPEEESKALSGGDTRMKLNASRTKLTVQVIDNEYEARLGRIPPTQTYEIDVHNRVVNTKSAPFMPTARSAQVTAPLGALTSVPAPFPEGYWSITGSRAVDGKYGPYMISTNAVGVVDVYSKETSNYVGSYTDQGYAIHANTNPFQSSKSYGCIVANQADIKKLEATLAADKARNKNARQKILVMNH